MRHSFNKKFGRRINDEIASVVGKVDGKFQEVDLSFDGVNAWRKSMGLALISKDEWNKNNPLNQVK